MPVVAAASVSPKTTTSEMDERSIKVNIDDEDGTDVHARNGKNHDADLVDVERGDASSPSIAAASEWSTRVKLSSQVIASVCRLQSMTPRKNLGHHS